MKTDIQEDFKTFNKAMNWAKNRGYVIPSMEYAVLYKGSAHAYGKSWSMRIWASGLLFDHEFARAFFGDRLMHRTRSDMGLIKIWAKQFAVEHEGKIYNARPNMPYTTFLEYDDTEWWADRSPTEMVEAKQVTKHLKDLVASIPFQTHKIEDVEVHDITPGISAYEYHLEKMATDNNPFDYLKRFMKVKKSYDTY